MMIDKIYIFLFSEAINSESKRSDLHKAVKIHALKPVEGKDYKKCAFKVVISWIFHYLTACQKSVLEWKLKTPFLTKYLLP